MFAVIKYCIIFDLSITKQGVPPGFSAKTGKKIMTTILPTPEVIYADAIFSGYGHKKVTVQLMANGETKRFSAVTNFMPGIDKAEDLEGQERYDALYDLIESDIEDQVIEWLYLIN